MSSTVPIILIHGLNLTQARLMLVGITVHAYWWLSPEQAMPGAIAIAPFSRIGRVLLQIAILGCDVFIFECFLLLFF